MHRLCAEMADNRLSETNFYLREAFLELERSYLWFYHFDSSTNSRIHDKLLMTNVSIVLQKLGLTTHWSQLVLQKPYTGID